MSKCGPACKIKYAILLAAICLASAGLNADPKKEGDGASKVRLAQSVPLISRDQWALKDSKSAIDAAWKYLGDRPIENIKAKAALTKFQSDNTPFVSEVITRGECWKIEINAVSVPHSKGGETDRRDIEMLIDPGTGKLLRIDAFTHERRPGEFEEFDAPAAEQIIRRGGGEEWTSLPECPGVTFVEALNAIEKHGFAFTSAKQIVAVCVNERTGFRDEGAVWSIELRDSAPHGYGHAAPKDQTYTRHIVSAVTGKWNRATTRPGSAHSRNAKTPSNDTDPNKQSIDPSGKEADSHK